MLSQVKKHTQIYLTERFFLFASHSSTACEQHREVTHPGIYVVCKTNQKNIVGVLFRRNSCENAAPDKTPSKLKIRCSVLLFPGRKELNLSNAL